MKITDVILDFDGTCTQIPLVYEKFLTDYLTGINTVLPADKPVTPDFWESAKKLVFQHSPAAGWMTAGNTPAAPAAADPYILGGEAAKYAFKYLLNTKTGVPLSAFTNAYAANPAPWRPEALQVIKTLIQNNVRVHIVSNSDPTQVSQRLTELWNDHPDTITTEGNAGKYYINEPDWAVTKDWSEGIKKAYHKVPAVDTHINIGRPLYLHRGSFAIIIANLLNNNINNLPGFVFCGDVWELDLALPAALGGKIHLIERAKPFSTYDYEKEITCSVGGKISTDLTGLLEWL